MLSVRTPRIAAGDEEESGSLVDHHASREPARPSTGALFDVESKAEQVGNLVVQPGSVVFPAAPIRKSE
jgi:hypothetical protein